MTKATPTQLAATHSPAVCAKIDAVMAAVGPRLPDVPGSKDRLRRLLEGVAVIAFEAGQDFQARQWDTAMNAIPKCVHDSYAAGVWIAMDILKEAGSIEEARDRIMAHAVFVAPDGVKGTP